MSDYHIIEQLLQDARIEIARLEGKCDAQCDEIVRANVDRDFAWQKIAELREQIAALGAQRRAVADGDEARNEKLLRGLYDTLTVDTADAGTDYDEDELINLVQQAVNDRRTVEQLQREKDEGRGVLALMADVRAANGAHSVQIDGVKIVACDTYGNTQSDSDLTRCREECARLERQLAESADAASLQQQIDRQAAALQAIAVHLGIEGEPTVEAIVARAAELTPMEQLAANAELAELRQRVEQLTEANMALRRGISLSASETTTTTADDDASGSTWGCAYGC